MNKVVKVRLDGKTVEAPEGSTILDVAKQEGVYIPTLCYSPLLPPLENCRLCVVAVAGERQYKPACSTAVSDGMDIVTGNDDLLQTRKLLLELLLDTHYGDCVAPCSVTCPANVDIQGYLALIRAGEYLEAVKLIKQKIPMPASIGRVCPHPCEGACRRHLVDEAVNINHCKRFVSDYERTTGQRVLPSVPEATGHRVAIVGGGPAGLSAAYYLRALGHGTTIFEARDKLGGMLRYGIPEYRLPKKILDWEINGILSLGVEVKTGVRWGKDFTLDDLKKEGFDALFLAIGAWESRRLGIVGEDLNGVVSGVDLLEKIGAKQPVDIGKKVVVIGGGNVAIDAARSALRLGSEQVTILYRRSRKEMPASHEEIEAAEAEGIDIQLLAAPIRALGEDGVLQQVEFIRMELGEPDASGRRRPVPVEGSETLMEVDQLISAIGQYPEIILPEQDGTMQKMPITRWSTIGGDPRSMYTGQEAVFVGGDLFQGPMTVVAALADGRKAAYSLNRYFVVGTVQPEPLHFNISKGDLTAIDSEPFEAMKIIARERMPELDTAKRIGNFLEVELGFGEEQARREAERCLVCGCSAAFNCKLREYMNEFQVDWRDQPSKKIHYQRVATVDVHPEISLDPNKCIRCERCVTACSTFQCSDAIDFKNWPRFNDQCVSCGLCVDLCPTGALMEKRVGRAVERLDWDTISTHCIHCGCGCQLDLKVKGDRLVWIANGSQSPPGDASTCSKGRFHAYDTHWYGSRIRSPLLRIDGSLQEVSWGKAIEATLHGLKRVAEDQGGQAIAALASPRASNEALYLLQKWMRMGWQSNGLDFPGRAAAESFLKVVRQETGKTGLSRPMSGLDRARAILVWGGNIEQVAPVIATRIRRAERGRDVPLCLVGAEGNGLSGFARLSVPAEPEVWADMAEFMVDATNGYEFEEAKHGVSQALFDELKEAVASSESLATVFPVPLSDRLSKEENEKFVRAILALASRGRSGGPGELEVYGCFREINILGALLMGASPAMLPGFLDLSDPRARRKFQSSAEGVELPGALETVPAAALEQGGISGLIVMEGSLYWERDLGDWQQRLKQAPFTVLLDALESPAMESAQVVLPVAAFGEQNGTVINHEKRVLHLNRAMPPDGSAMADWEAISQIMATQGLPFPRDLNAIRWEISRMVAELADFDWEEKNPENTLLG